LQQWGEEDDATSPLKELAPLKREVDLQNFHDSDLTAFPEVSSFSFFWSEFGVQSDI